MSDKRSMSYIRVAQKNFRGGPGNFLLLRIELRGGGDLAKLATDQEIFALPSCAAGRIRKNGSIALQGKNNKGLASEEQNRSHPHCKWFYKHVDEFSLLQLGFPLRLCQKAECASAGR
jgi:hypothetical protein